MVSGASDLIEIDETVRVETNNAYGVDDPNDCANLIWLPKSQCEFDGEKITLPEWLAIEKGLV